jgi:AcrR family transcriptional regulator
MDGGSELARTGGQGRTAARDRLLSSAYTLFSRHATRAVGVDTIIDHARVAKKTLYTHFASKDELIVAFLREREEKWTRAWLQAEVRRRAATPAGRLLAIFEVFGEWFARVDFEGCSFINVMLEVTERKSPVRRESVTQLANIREFLGELVADAGIADADGVARQWHILMKGSIVAAAEGDQDAAVRAAELGRLLLASHGVEVPEPTGR